MKDIVKTPDSFKNMLSGAKVKVKIKVKGKMKKGSALQKFLMKKKD